MIDLPVAQPPGPAGPAPASGAAGISPARSPAEPLERQGLLTPVLRYEVGGEPYLFIGETNTMLGLDAVAADLVAELARPDASLEGAIAACSPRHGAMATRAALGELVAERAVALAGVALPAPPVPPAELPLRSIVLNLAQGCNLSCSYCFADEGLYHDKHQGLMTSETARQAIDAGFAEGSGHLHVTFFGGEPTLNWATLQDAVAYGLERARELGRSVDYSLTTNGTLLDDDRIDFLAAHRVGVSVSLDGPPDVHDRHRLTRDGRGSADRVFARVRRLLERHRTRPIGCRVTLAAGNTDVERSFDYLIEMGFAEVGFAPVTTSRTDLLLPEAEMAEVLSGFERLARRTTAAALAGELLGFSNLVNTWQELHEGKIKAYSCGAGIGLVSVGATGGLYLCHRFTGAAEFQLGSLAEGLDREARTAFLTAAHVRHKEPCQTCWLKHTCAGGCYHEAWQRQGSALAPNAHYCEFMRTWMEVAIATYTEVANANPDFIRRHVAPRKRPPVSEPLV